MSQTSKSEIINWLTSRADEIDRSPDHLITETLNTLVGEARAIAAAWDNVACTSCGGFGERTYGSTSTWRGGIGGQSITVGVCDKCWGTGRSDKSGADLRQLHSRPSSSADPMLCSWCGYRKNSVDCQRSHS